MKPPAPGALQRHPSIRPPPLRRDADAPLSVDEFAIPTTELRLQGAFALRAAGGRRLFEAFAEQAGREATAEFGRRGHIDTLPQPKPPIIPNPPPQPPSKRPATPKRPNPPPRPPAKEWVPPRPPR